MKEAYRNVGALLKEQILRLLGLKIDLRMPKGQKAFPKKQYQKMEVTNIEVKDQHPDLIQLSLS